jgi:hypothetical protein
MVLKYAAVAEIRYIEIGKLINRDGRGTAEVERA